MSNDKKALGHETPKESASETRQHVKESEELVTLRVDNSRLTQELEGNKEVIHELRNLMAIMHRDGGHYTAKHGLINAIKDARILRNDLVLSVDHLQYENDRLRAQLDAIKLVVAECKPDLKSALESEEPVDPCYDCSAAGDEVECYFRNCRVRG